MPPSYSNHNRNARYDNRNQRNAPPPPQQRPPKGKLSTDKIIVGLLAVVLVMAMFVFYNNSKKQGAKLAEIEQKAMINEQEAKEFKVQAYKLRSLSRTIWNTIKQDLSSVEDQVVQAKIRAIDSLMSAIIKDTQLRKVDFDNYSTQLVFAYEDIFSISNDIRNRTVQKQVQEGLQEQGQVIAELKGKVRALQTENMRQKAEIAQLKGEKHAANQHNQRLNDVNRNLVTEKESLEEKEAYLKEENQQLTRTARLIEPKCYFWYKPDKNNSERIDLTDSGLSKKYKKFFQKNNPDIEIEFRVDPQLFSNNAALKIYLYSSEEEDAPINIQTVPIGTQKLNKKLTTNGMVANSYYIIVEDDNGENITQNGRYDFNIEQL